MQSSRWLTTFLVLTAFGSYPAPAGAGPAPDSPPSADRTLAFAREVEPVLHPRCYTCHGPSVQTDDLRFNRRETVLKGGYSGPVIVPDDSASTSLIHRIASSKEGFRMPPTDHV